MYAPPLSLYVHLPWCVKKCPYCDFNSYSLARGQAADASVRARYLDALLLDLELEATRVTDRELVSIFLGGGTPSLFTPAEISRLLAASARNFSWCDDIEITMEANPGTVECGDPAAYRAAGVNRLSIGAQSFSDASLSLLGRVHDSADITRAVTAAIGAGFANINIDIMYGLPGQSVAAALYDLERAIALGPQHISWYQLTLEPNTVFYARPPKGLPDNDFGFEIQMAGQALLRKHGYLQYEVSAYAKPGRRCRHNENYWSFGDYLAVGAGAHGKLTQAGKSHRYEKPANPASYMQHFESRSTTQADALPTPLAREALLFEFMLNALRLSDGFDENLLPDRTGLTVDYLAARAEVATRRALLER
ncbi:MAG TPA: radical SAM family heme chaperone HemW, partial [Woeseiaceae bacterium]|nr:radical SAM family heme chaperone HemW [Woeseiaceae bacterium]